MFDGDFSFHYDLHNSVVMTSLGFPDPNSFVSNIRDETMPQIIAWSTAIAGIALAVFLLKAFTK